MPWEVLTQRGNVRSARNRADAHLTNTATNFQHVVDVSTHDRAGSNQASRSGQPVLFDGIRIAIHLSMSRPSLSTVLVAWLIVVGPPMAHAQSGPPVEPIPADRPAPTSPPAIVPDLRAGPGSVHQADDIETPTSHPDPRGSQVSSRSPAEQPTASEPETSQLWVGLLVSAVTLAVIGKETNFGTKGNGWYTAAALTGGALATGAIVCVIGQSSPTRHGGCRGSIIGAVVGAVAIVPGLLLLRHGANSPCTATGANVDDQCAVNGFVDGFLDLSVASLGYVLGSAFGARTGWELGATPRYIPPAPAVNVVSLQF
jgi:hypothetical protein